MASRPPRAADSWQYLIHNGRRHRRAKAKAQDEVLVLRQDDEEVEQARLLFLNSVIRDWRGLRSSLNKL